MFRWSCVFLVAIWALLAATGHFFHGWIHVLPLAVALATAARFVYALVVAD